MVEKTPEWAKQLIKEVSNLKKQTAINCDKLTKIDLKISTTNAEIGGIKGRLNSVETHLVKQDRILNKIEKSL